MCQGISNFLGFLHHFVLPNSSIRVKTSYVKILAADVLLLMHLGHYNKIPITF